MVNVTTVPAVRSPRVIRITWGQVLERVHPQRGGEALGSLSAAATSTGQRSLSGHWLPLVITDPFWVDLYDLFRIWVDLHVLMLREPSGWL